MPARIKDKFTRGKTRAGKPMTRQQRYAKRMSARKLCPVCGDQTDGSYCLKHKKSNRERARKRLGCKLRYLGATSYDADEKKKLQAEQLRRSKRKPAVKPGTKNPFF